MATAQPPLAPSAPQSVDRVTLPVDNRVERLLLWRNPLDSGVFLAVVTVAYVFLVWSHRSLVSLVAVLSAVVVLTLFVWSTLAAYLNRPGPPLPAVLRQGISESQAKGYVELYLPLVNRGLANANLAVTGKDPVLAAKVFAVLLVVWKLGKIFSVLTWAYVVAVLAFSVPKLYELKKREIDSAAAQARAHGERLHSQYVAPALEKLPRASTATPFNKSGVDKKAI